GVLKGRFRDGVLALRVCGPSHSIGYMRSGEPEHQAGLPGRCPDGPDCVRQSRVATLVLECRANYFRAAKGSGCRRRIAANLRLTPVAEHVIPAHYRRGLWNRVGGMPPATQRIIACWQ